MFGFWIGGEEYVIGALGRESAWLPRVSEVGEAGIVICAKGGLGRTEVRLRLF